MYLFLTVLPLFRSAAAELGNQYAALADTDDPHWLELDEGADIAIRYSRSGEILVFQARDGRELARTSVPEPYLGELTGMFSTQDGRYVCYSTVDGKMLVMEREWVTRWENDVKRVRPVFRYPFGEQALDVGAEGRPLRRMAMAVTEGEAVFAAIVAVDQDVLAQDMVQDTALPRTELVMKRHVAEEDLFSEEGAAWTDAGGMRLPLSIQAEFLLLDPELRYVYVADANSVMQQFSIQDRKAARRLAEYQLLNDERLTAVEFLLGSRSILAGGDQGSIVQWGLVRDESILFRPLKRFRGFRLNGSVRMIRNEHRRKGFMAVSDQGWLGIYHSTAGKRLLHRELFPSDVRDMAVSPRADALLASTEDRQFRFFTLDNPHPEISWNALWGKVWYEDYDAPAHVWQSSSASQDFEPKFSLAPLAYGTFKATFYAILFAIPIALMGGIYTAYFMSAAMRGLVKPVIEIMEALPTVILGFLAGLWLAPYAEENLLGILLHVPALPVMFLLVSWLSVRFLPRLTSRLDEGWHAFLLVPVVVLVSWGIMESATVLEGLWFERGMIHWLNSIGMDFSQRNSLVIGIAMGFAVIPTIFSITEDAVFEVPKHLSRGSLALGATAWQTLVKVVLLTASPAIFAAVMMGLGRVVGETMIVLMATGNTPLMDMNIFHGMRTLSANIAVELPEAENSSTHYRMLFLSAILLFLFTFFFNTISELVRSRLRARYSSL